MFVATKVCLDKHTLVATIDVFCRDMILGDRLGGGGGGGCTGSVFILVKCN